MEEWIWKGWLVTLSRSALFPPGSIPTHSSAPPSSQRIRDAHIQKQFRHCKISDKRKMLLWWPATQKQNTQLKKGILSVGSFSLFPSRDKCKTRRREKTAPKKKKTTSEKFWSGENAEGGSTLELGITYCPEYREGRKTCCRWQLLPTDAQIAMSRTRRREATEETSPASARLSFSLTLLRPIQHRCITFWTEQLVDKEEETWARTAFQTWSIIW